MRAVRRAIYDRVDAWIAAGLLVPGFMAGDGGNTSCILLKDMVGEQEGHFSLLRFGQTPPETVNIQRGELLVPSRQKEESSLPDHHQLSQSKLACKLWRDSNITIQCRPDEFAWLDNVEFDILEAVQSPLSRYEEFCMDKKLSWASKLKLGSVVHVRMTGEARTVVQYAEGVVRYIGKIAKNPGQMFGVEITVCSKACNVFQYGLLGTIRSILRLMGALCVAFSPRFLALFPGLLFFSLR